MSTNNAGEPLFTLDTLIEARSFLAGAPISFRYSCGDGVDVVYAIGDKWYHEHKRRDGEPGEEYFVMETGKPMYQ